RKMRRQYSSRRNGIYADLAALGKLEPHPTPHQQAFPEPYRGKWSAETPAPRWRAKLLSEPQLLGTTVRARRTVANSRSIRLLHPTCSTGSVSSRGSNRLCSR